MILQWPWWAVLIYAVGPIFAFSGFFFLEQRTDIPTTFQCPLVPLVPCLAMYINIYLIFSLPAASFVRLLLWTALGFAIYFGYGIRYSKEGLWEREQLEFEGEAEPISRHGSLDRSTSSHLSGHLSGKLY